MPCGASGGQVGGVARGTTLGRRSLPGVPHSSGAGMVGAPISCLSVLFRRMPPLRNSVLDPWGLAVPSGALLWVQSQRRPGGLDVSRG